MSTPVDITYGGALLNLSTMIVPTMIVPTMAPDNGGPAVNGGPPDNGGPGDNANEEFSDGFSSDDSWEPTGGKYYSSDDESVRTFSDSDYEL